MQPFLNKIFLIFSLFVGNFKLVEDVQEFDSKVQVLNTISVLIAYVGDIIPYANELVHFFGKIFNPITEFSQTYHKS